MRNAETVLSVIRDRGKRRLPLEDVYRQLFNPDLYIRAYGRIAKNAGAMTPGVTAETVDGMSLAKIGKIVEAIRFERYRWKSVRRVHIPKFNGKMRPLGLPVWSDKLLQEVIRSLLEAYYEPQFSEHSHGFRPDRGCHTALSVIRQTWKGTKWYIEGDIKSCFDNIDHTVLLSILRENIHDNRFLRLIENLLQAGYCEEWHYHPTYSGTPQGGIVSPLLANIYLNKLDWFITDELLPRYNRGSQRRENPEYKRISNRFNRLKNTGHEEVAGLYLRRRELPPRDPHDPNYRRLRYVRYADDFILGFAGPKVEAEAIKQEISSFLHQHLNLELSEEKTLITHAASQAAKFLGYELVSQHSDCRRAVNGVMALRVPAQIIESRCSRYMKGGKVVHRFELAQHSDYHIVAQYQAEFRGYVQYYALAQNRCWFNRVQWVMGTSLLKTLAHKHKSRVGPILKKLRATVETPNGPRRCLRVTTARAGKEPLVAYFGGISLSYQKTAILKDHRLDLFFKPRTGLEKRFMAETCELCGSTEQVEVHHIRKLADLTTHGRRERPLWKQVMSAIRRKQLVVCHECHVAIHAGNPTRQRAVQE